MCVERRRGNAIPCEVVYDGFGWFDELVAYDNARLVVSTPPHKLRRIIM